MRRNVAWGLARKKTRLKGATAPRKRNVAKVAPFRRGRCAEHSPSARFASRMGLPLFRPAGAWGRRHSCLRPCGIRFPADVFSPRGVPAPHDEDVDVFAPRGSAGDVPARRAVPPSRAHVHEDREAEHHEPADEIRVVVADEPRPPVDIDGNEQRAPKPRTRRRVEALLLQTRLVD